VSRAPAPQASWRETGEQDLIGGPPIPVGVLMRRLAALAWSHKWVALPAVIATVAVQGLTLAGLAGQGLAIDVVRATMDAGAPRPRWPLGLTPPADWGLLSLIAAVGVLVLLTSVLAGFGRYWTRVADERFVQACVVDLRTKLYDKLQRLPFGFFDRIDTGQIINRVTGDSQQVRNFIQGIMIRAGIALITLAIFLFYMLQTSAWLTLACLVVYPLQVLVMVRYGRVTKPKFIEQSRLVDIVVKSMQEAIAGVRVIRVFGRERWMTDRFQQHSEAARDQRLTLARDQATHTPFVGATNFISQAVLLGFGGWLVMRGPADGGIALGTLWIFRGLLDRLASQADAIVAIIGEAPESLAGAERVYKLLDHPIDIQSKPGAALPLLDDGTRGIAGEVEFRDVTFGYAPEKPVLRGVSFKVRAGEIVAVVGPTGAGKSTLLSLIPRFYDPQTGRVLIDGVDVRDMPVEELRRRVGIVFQEPFLFSNTVRSNVAFAEPDAAMDEVHEASEAAAARTFIEEMPQGYQTLIGERGVSLSGGQRQRLTIARALLADPAILVLDDATGSIDALTERDIQQALATHMKGRTTFIVAHRLSTLRKADRIIVIDKGRIVDTGSHQELMSRAGHYRASALIQLALEDPDEGPAQLRGEGVG
jgi:ABC-type multidrug transport system fused ATPase/permease subunit